MDAQDLKRHLALLFHMNRITQRLSNPNVLDYFNAQRLLAQPPHFHYVTLGTSKMHVQKWITENVRGRYYLDYKYQDPMKLKESMQLCVGFEDPKEMTYFLLTCPYTTGEYNG